MARVAIVTDSAADLAPAVAEARGIIVVPLEVTFGKDRFRAGVDLSIEQFWARMVAPDAPFPTTAAPSPGDFHAAFESAFAAGAEAVVAVDVADTLSGTIKSARIARDMLPNREIHVVDSMTASMGVGILAELACDLAAAGLPAAEIAATVEARRSDIGVQVAVDTLEYLKRGGRLSAAAAAIGGLLSVKPLITIREGHVEVGERVRTRSKVRERCAELLAEAPIERLAILHTTSADVEEFAREVVSRVPGGIAPEAVSVDIVGASVGPHLGPGCVGGAVLRRRS